MRPSAPTTNHLLRIVHRTHNPAAAGFLFRHPASDSCAFYTLACQATGIVPMRYGLIQFRPQVTGPWLTTAQQRGSSRDLNPMKALVVEVREGLCNRLRVLVSACYLARRYGRELILCWRPDHKCGARFGDLFTNLMGETDSLPEYPRPRMGIPPDELARAIQSPDPIVCVRECHWLVAEMDQRKTIEHFRALRPVDAVTRAADAIAARFPGWTIGVHVRRGDFAPHLLKRHDLKLPALERYFAYLDNWRGAIFLATDGGDEVVQRFCDRYGDRLLIYPRNSPGRSTPQAVQEALVDLYLLQRCQAIIGTRFSSFSELAWCITKAPYAKVSEREVGFFAKTQVLIPAHVEPHAASLISLDLSAGRQRVTRLINLSVSRLSKQTTLFMRQRSRAGNSSV